MFDAPKTMNVRDALALYESLSPESQAELYAGLPGNRSIARRLMQAMVQVADPRQDTRRAI